MAVQILNDMPDAEIHRGEPVARRPRELLRPRDWVAPPAPVEARTMSTRFGGRAGFLAVVIGMHAVAAIGLMQMTLHESAPLEAAPIEAALIEAPAQNDLPPPAFTPPPMDVVYTVPIPQEIAVETDAITIPVVTDTAVDSRSQSAGAPPLVETVEYVRTESPVYPKESQRKREHGTVVLRVLVDTAGRPAQIQVERSSGFARLDSAAREAVEKFLFRPYEVNGVAQPAQVLIPIGFDRRSS